MRRAEAHIRYPRWCEFGGQGATEVGHHSAGGANGQVTGVGLARGAALMFTTRAASERSRRYEAGLRPRSYRLGRLRRPPCVLHQVLAEKVEGATKDLVKVDLTGIGGGCALQAAFVQDAFTGRDQTEHRSGMVGVVRSLVTEVLGGHEHGLCLRQVTPTS